MAIHLQIATQAVPHAEPIVLGAGSEAEATPMWYLIKGSDCRKGGR